MSDIIYSNSSEEDIKKFYSVIDSMKLDFEKSMNKPQVKKE